MAVVSEVSTESGGGFFSQALASGATHRAITTPADGSGEMSSAFATPNPEAFLEQTINALSGAVNWSHVVTSLIDVSMLEPSDKPDLDYWELDKFGYLFPQIEGVVAHYTYEREKKESGIHVEMPFAYPGIFWAGAMRDEHRISVAANAEQIVIVVACEIDGAGTRKAGVNPMQGVIPTGEIFSYWFDGRLCRADQIGWMDGKPYQVKREIICPLDSRLIDVLASRLEELKERIKQ